MNRRHFMTAMGGATAAAASLMHANRAFATETTTSFYVKGLILVSFEDSNVLRLGLPKAPGHKATLALVPQAGSQRTLSLKGNYSVATAAKSTGKPEYKIPELIRMQELYGNNIHSRVNECPTVISIPYAAIKSITAPETSPTRYTFVRADNGKEIATFRPRKIAETLKIELSSDTVMNLDGGKTTVALNSMKEVHAEYAPEDASVVAGVDAFTAHFPHYNAYLDRPANANFDVLPKNLGPSSSATPRVGSNFMPIWPYTLCFVVGV
jgi:hypothetical protein